MSLEALLRGSRAVAIRAGDCSVQVEKDPKSFTSSKSQLKPTSTAKSALSLTYPETIDSIACDIWIRPRSCTLTLPVFPASSLFRGSPAVDEMHPDELAVHPRSSHARVRVGPHEAAQIVAHRAEQMSCMKLGAAIDELTEIREILHGRDEHPQRGSAVRATTSSSGRVRRNFRPRLVQRVNDGAVVRGAGSGRRSRTGARGAIALGVVPVGKIQQTSPGERIGLLGEVPDPVVEALVEFLLHDATPRRDRWS